MTLNYIERMKYYNELKRDYDLQKIENGKKQDTIIKLSKEIKELKNQIKEMKKKPTKNIKGCKH